MAAPTSMQRNKEEAAVAAVVSVATPAAAVAVELVAMPVAVARVGQVVQAVRVVPRSNHRPPNAPIASEPPAHQGSHA